MIDQEASRAVRSRASAAEREPFRVRSQARPACGGPSGRAERQLAAAVGADAATVCHGGRVLALTAALLALAGPGERVLASRQADAALMSAMILSGVRPVWLPAAAHGGSVVHPPVPDQIEHAVAGSADVRGVLLQSPSIWGVCADLDGLVAAAHRSDVPLLVDETWGAHFPFHSRLPRSAMAAGADLAVSGVWAGGAVGSPSVVYRRGRRIAAERIVAPHGLAGTIHAAHATVAAPQTFRRHDGGDARALEFALNRADRLRSDADDVEGLAVLELTRGAGDGTSLDPLQVVLDLGGLAVTGYQAAGWLQATCGWRPRAADVSRIAVGFADAGPDDAEATGSALRQLAGVTSTRPTREAAMPVPGPPLPEVAMAPREAYLGRSERIPLVAGRGRIAAETVIAHPPGAVALAPGEVVDAELMDYLVSGVGSGALALEATDALGASLQVVAT